MDNKGLKGRLTSLYHHHQEAILYVIFGGLTTLVNIVAFWLLSRVGMATVPATAISWVLSVLFAYVTNRTCVFHSTVKDFLPILREVGAFFGARALSGVMDLGIMALFVDVLHLPSMPVKIASNVLVIIMNYVVSKCFIFKAPGKAEEAAQSAGDAPGSSTDDV